MRYTLIRIGELGMELIVTVLMFIGGGLLLNTRSRLSRTEHRLLLVENELRRR